MHNTFYHRSKLWQISLFSKSASFWLSSCPNPSLKCQGRISSYRTALCEMENKQQAAGPLSHASHSSIHPVLASGLQLWVFTGSFPLLYLGFPSPLGCGNKTSPIMI